ncbi:hypothetical protein [Spiroplasma tabanidicola]|uniref:Uncharacterized protein n=1 Tax=Spiroplasma tabanidicola TaxID=324079 RepID=A0A6I6C7G3_9MOLU|nr:hypothetical protein [Spiroplasma tabanidicola]QGS52150.1 hypothetical protein STABA_v1c07940 [Spiroplasma tabanidicola]
MKNNKNKYNVLKELRKDQRDAHKDFVNNKVDEVLDDYVEKHSEYISSKKLRWYDYIIIVFISILITGLSFIISIYGFKDITRTNYFTAAAGFLGLFIWIVYGFVINRRTAKFYNDSRRRYSSTLSPEEALSRRINKCFFFGSIILLIISLICYFSI